MLLKRVIRILKYLFLSLVILITVILAGINLPVSQRLISARANDYFRNNDLPVQVDRISLLITGKIGVRNLKISGPENDTIVYSEKINISARFFPLIFRKVVIKNISLRRAVVNIYVDSISGVPNIAAVFSKTTSPADTVSKTGSRWEINGENVSLADVRFRFRDAGSGIEISQSVGKLEIGLDELSIVSKKIYVGYLDLADADGGMIIRNGNGEMPDPVEPSKASPWEFRLRKSELRKIHFTIDQPGENQSMTFRLGRGEISDASFALETKRITAGKTEIREGSFKKGVLYGDTASAEQNTLLNISDLNTLINDLVLSRGSSGFRMDALSFSMENGVRLREGEISLDSDSVNGSSLRADLKTGSGRINITAEAGAPLSEILRSYRGAPFSLKIDDTEIAAAELIALLPSFSNQLQGKGMESVMLGLSCDISGTTDNLEVNSIRLYTSRGFTLFATGKVAGITEPETSRCLLSFKTGNVLPVHVKELATLFGTAYEIPEFEPLTISGTIDSTLINPVFSLSVMGGTGNITVDGSMNRLSKDYTLGMILSGVDIGVLTGVQQAGRLTGKINLTGDDFDPHLMKLMATVSIDTMQFRKYIYKGITIDVKGDSGVFDAGLKSDDKAFACDLKGTADINNSSLKGSLKGWMDVDAGKLNLLDEMAFNGDLDVTMERSAGIIQGSFTLADFVVARKDKREELSNLSVTFLSSDSLTSGSVEADFIKADAFYKGTPGGMLKVLRENRLRGFAMVDSAVGNRIPYLSAISEMNMSVETTYDPFIALFVNDSIFSYNKLSALIYKDTSDVAKAEIRVDRINAGRSTVSGASVIMESLADKSVLNINADSVRFADISLSDLAASFIIEEDSAKFHLTSGSSGDSLVYDISGAAYKSNGNIRLKSDIGDWIINGYRWNITPGDFLVLEPGANDFTADFHLSENSNHTIDIYGRKSEKLFLETSEVGLKMILPPGMVDSGYNGIFTGRIDYMSREGKNALGVIMKIDKISIDENLLGKVEIEGRYKSDTLGTIESDLSAVINDTSGVELTVRSSDLNREKNIRTEFSDIQLNNFEPFISDYISGLRGIVSGNLEIVSKNEKPQINGKLELRSTALKLIPVNSWYFLSDDAIRIDNNKLIFNKFTVRDSLSNPLILSGIVDLTDPKKITSDLQVSSDRLQVMNTTSNDNAGFNGSIFINSRINISGPLQNPSIDGNLVLADGTVINYRYSENLSVSETGKIVTFASLKQVGDTVANQPVSDMITRTPDIEATVEIDPNSLFNFYVSKGFDISVSITGGGFLTYSLMPNNEIDLSGIYEINQGTSRLKLPGWPRKDFIITKGSVIRWDGKIDDPDLSIETNSNVRGSYVNPVDNQQREVNFVVTMKLQGRLSELGIIFDVRSQDQYITTFFNSLSADERMKQAINLLILEKVELPGQTSSSNYLTQQISQFAENQINQATKSASKKLDLDVSLGVDTYTRATSTGEQTTTSLSYQVKKDMFNERGSVLLSGHANAGTTAGQQTNSVIENFIFEYALDSIRSKFLKIYRQQNYEDLLEGEVIKSGVGFIYRKSYDRLSDIWRRQKRSKK